MTKKRMVMARMVRHLKDLNQTFDLDKDENKTEPMKSAAKSKKEETEYNYVNQYLENAPRMQKGAMAYDDPNKAASEAKG